MTVSLSPTHTLLVAFPPSCSPSPSTPNPCSSGAGQTAGAETHLHASRPDGHLDWTAKGGREMGYDAKGISRRVVPLLGSFGFSLVLTAGNPPAQLPEEQALLASARPPLKVLMDTEESFWVLQPNSSEVIRYSRSGQIIGGCNVTVAKGLLPGARITAHDIALRSDGSLHILVGAVNLRTDEIASYVARCTGEKVELLTLSEPVAAFRLGIDREGVIHILGLREPDFRAVDVGQHVVHRFSPEGALLGSYLPMKLDPTTAETHTHTIGNPFHA